MKHPPPCEYNDSIRDANREFGDFCTCPSKSWISGAEKIGHVCNCIGCCTKCGGCRTNPKHTPEACAKVAGLKQQIQDVYRDEYCLCGDPGDCNEAH